MTITLKPEQEKIIADAMGTGAYQDASDVIQHALEMLRFEDDWMTDERKEISAKLEQAFEGSERGILYSPEEVRANMAKRKAEWLRERQPG